MINELAQWIAIASLSLFVGAVFVRLGNKLPSQRDPQEEFDSFGAPEGNQAPNSFLQLVPQRASAPALVVWVSDTCAACKTLLDEIDGTIASSTADVALGIVAMGEPSYQDALALRFPTANVYDAATQGDSVTAPGTPIWMVFSNEGIVTARGFGYDSGALEKAVASSRLAGH